MLNKPRSLEFLTKAAASARVCNLRPEGKDSRVSDPCEGEAVPLEADRNRLLQSTWTVPNRTRAQDSRAKAPLRPGSMIFDGNFFNSVAHKETSVRKQVMSWLRFRYPCPLGGDVRSSRTWAITTTMCSRTEPTWDASWKPLRPVLSVL